MFAKKKEDSLKFIRSGSKPRNTEKTQLLNDSVLYSLDPEILELCDELESLGGGIKTRIEAIQAQMLRKD